MPDLPRSAPAPRIHPSPTISIPHFVARNKPPSIVIFTNELIEASGAKTTAWGKASPNAADFDVVILDLVTLAKAIDGGFDVSRMRGPSKSQIGQLLSANGLVIAIVPPVAYFRPKKGGRLPLYWWSPIPI